MATGKKRASDGGGEAGTRRGIPSCSPVDQRAIGQKSVVAAMAHDVPHQSRLLVPVPVPLFTLPATACTCHGTCLPSRSSIESGGCITHRPPARFKKNRSDRPTKSVNHVVRSQTTTTLSKQKRRGACPPNKRYTKQKLRPAAAVSKNARHEPEERAVTFAGTRLRPGA